MKTIVWDVDDVLNNLMHDWFESWWLPAHPQSTLGYQQLKKNPPHTVLNISIEEYLESLDDFRSSSFSSMKPVPEVMEWFHKYGENYRHIALTATPIRFADLSASWVIKHFGKWIRSFNFVPSHRREEVIPDYDRTKQDFLVWWRKADILVDDNENNTLAAQSVGVFPVLMPRPWNSKHTIKAVTCEQLNNWLRCDS
ncbi:MAG TPA: hypothetical protein VIO61_00760 [Anaerolineaceae bacterium]